MAVERLQYEKHGGQLSTSGRYSMHTRLRGIVAEYMMPDPYARVDLAPRGYLIISARDNCMIMLIESLIEILYNLLIAIGPRPYDIFATADPSGTNDYSGGNLPGGIASKLMR